jgi:hypothetical protein
VAEDSIRFIPPNSKGFCEETGDQLNGDDGWNQPLPNRRAKDRNWQIRAFLYDAGDDPSGT